MLVTHTECELSDGNYIKCIFNFCAVPVLLLMLLYMDESIRLFNSLSLLALELFVRLQPSQKADEGDVPEKWQCAKSTENYGEDHLRHVFGEESSSTSFSFFSRL